MKDRLIIFLDIDGVLNSGITAEKWAKERKQPEGVLVYRDQGMLDWVEVNKLEMLKAFIKKHGARVVGVSSWFYGQNARMTPERHFANVSVFEFLGIEDISLGTVACTGGGTDRGDSVLQYVNDHELTKWIVIDDSGEDMYDYWTHQINGRTGITKEDFDFFDRLIEGSKMIKEYFK